MREILPGVFHWTAVHPRIGIEVSSYYLAPEKVAIDPLVPGEGLRWFTRGVDHVLLTNRLHYRHSARFARRFGCTVWCARSGVRDLAPNRKARPFRFGDVLPGRIDAIEIGALCPDEGALLIPRASGIVALADGAVRHRDGPLIFVPDECMGDDPAGVRAGLRRAYRRLLRRRFDHLLLAHGNPWIGGGKDALRRFVEA
jgi:hypothetical protein